MTRRLDVALVDRKLVTTRTKAQRLIAGGWVSVDGQVVTKASSPVYDSSTITVEGSHTDVGRGAVKLRAALDTWSIPVDGALCADIGASTGGFTQVLLERGATTVVALDVGHAQLDPTLRDNPNVINWEGVHAGTLSRRWWTSEQLPEPIDVVVVDVSFISLTKVLPALFETFGVHSHYVLLVKPQFEVGRSGIDEGIVKDPLKQEHAIRDVAQLCASSGCVVRGVMVSPISGEAGNVEYLAYASATSSAHPAEWDAVIPTPPEP